MTVNINGTRKTVDEGANIIINNNSVFVDGHDVAGTVEGTVKVTIEGNVGSIDCEGSVSVVGDVHGDISAKGNANINGDVSGSVRSNGSCSCNRVSGDISCTGNLAIGRK